MTTEQFNKANKIQEYIQNLKEVQKFLNNIIGEYRQVLQSSRKCFLLNKPEIRDKVIGRIKELEEEFELINQRIKVLEEEFKAL